MSRTMLIGFCLAVIAGLPTSSQAQELDLPIMEAEQRWDRASYNLSLFAAVYLAKGMSTGMTPEEVGRELATQLGPWPTVETAQDMAATIFRNWQSWRSVEFRAEVSIDDSVVVVANRPYTGALVRYSKIGVSVTEFDGMWGAFHGAIAHAQGLSFDQSIIDDSTVRMTIRR